MTTARWNDVVLAESDHCRMVEGNYYFPPDSIHREYLTPSRARSLCFWKGFASYYDIEVDGVRNPNAAWYYPAPTWLPSTALLVSIRSPLQASRQKPLFGNQCKGNELATRLE